MVVGTTGAPINRSGVPTDSVAVEDGESTCGRGEGDQSEPEPELSGESWLEEEEKFTQNCLKVEIKRCHRRSLFSSGVDGGQLAEVHLTIGAGGP